MSRVEIPVLQRAFRRSLNQWLDLLLKWRVALEEGDSTAPAAIARLASRLADAATHYGLATLEQAARAAAQAHLSRSLAERAVALTAAVRAEMHPNRHQTALSAPIRSVLVVASDRRLIERLHAHIKTLGHKLEVSSTASAAKSFMARSRIDLAILDLDLPEDLLGWLIELRTSSADPDIPVIVSSATGELRADALLFGASEFFRRDVPPEVVEEAAVTYLGSASARAPLSGDLSAALPEASQMRAALADRTLLRAGGPWCFLAVVWRNRLSLLENPALMRVASMAIADGLQERFPEPSLVSRLDTDTFAVLIPEIDVEQNELLIEAAIDSLVETAPSMLDLGVGGVVAREGEYGIVLSTARRMQELAAIAGQRVLLTTLDGAPLQKILFVSPEEGPVQTLRLVLRGLTVDVISRRTAVEALSAASVAPFDMVLLSAALPDQGAFEILSALRQVQEYADKPIIVVVSNDTDRVRAYESGADDCCVIPPPREDGALPGPPFSPDVLRARLRSRL